jgi:hypothetical protein
MSNAPAPTPGRADPVAIALNALAVLHSVVPSSSPGSGVPATAACHSAFDGSRLPAFSPRLRLEPREVHRRRHGRQLTA